MSMVGALRILLVDDEEIVHQTIGDYLSDCGHQVEKSLDGRAAVQAVERVSYDLALVDVRMPGMDGLAFLDRVGELCPEMPVVIITGHGDAEMENEVRRRGAAGFLVKPIRLRELDSLLADVARRR